MLKSLWRWDISTAETSLIDKKVTFEKNNCPVYTILLVTIWLILLVTSIIQNIG